MNSGYDIIYKHQELKPYLNFINKLLSRKVIKAKKGTHLHHIVPRAMSGGDEYDNLIRVTINDHKKIHQLLMKCLKITKFKAFYSKMAYASRMMGKPLHHNHSNKPVLSKLKDLTRLYKTTKDNVVKLENRVTDLESRLSEALEYIEDLERI